MSESLADVIARLQVSIRPHAVPPVTVRRLPTDSAPPAGIAEGMPDRAANTMAGRRQGARYPGTYKPRSADLANAGPATSRPAGGSVKPSGGRKIGARGAEQARADSENAGRAAWVSARVTLERDAGDNLPAGQHYPRTVTRGGNLGPQARY